MHMAERDGKQKPGLRLSHLPEARSLVLLLLPWLLFASSSGGRHSHSFVPACLGAGGRDGLSLVAAEPPSDGGRCSACLWQLISHSYAIAGVSCSGLCSLASVSFWSVSPPLLLIRAAFDARGPPLS